MDSLGLGVRPPVTDYELGMLSARLANDKIEHVWMDAWQLRRIVQEIRELRVLFEVAG
jgi:hypothetical protein